MTDDPADRPGPDPTPAPGARIPRWRSVRLRIASAVSVVAFLVSSAVGWTLAQQSAQAATQAMRDVALSRLAVVTDGYSLDGRLRSGASLNPPTLPDPLADRLTHATSRDRATYYDGRLMWAATRLGPDVVLAVALDAGTLERQDEQRMRTLALAMLGSLASALALGWVSGNTLSRRLRTAADAAHLIAAGSSSARAAQPGSDEVAVLTRMIDDMADALRQRITAEQDFTADVAHELRTPLTALVSASELLDDGPATDLVRAQITRLRRLVTDRLEISRLDRGVESAVCEAVRLPEAVREALGNLPEGEAELSLATSDGLDPAAPSEDALVLVEQRRLERVLGNLAINVARHGGGSGRITVSPDQVVVSDDGPGYPEDILTDGPRRFRSNPGSTGSGLGLTIVQRQMAVMGGQVRFGRSATGGAQTTLTFARA